MVEFTGNKVIVMCCSSCNMHCEHCYISYKGDRTPEELLEVVRNLKGKYNIALNGAEVLTNFGFLESYKELGQKYILSNGLVVSSDYSTIDELIEFGIESISISYHFGIHDKISLIPSEMLEKLFQELNRRNFKFRLMTTITSKNYHMIEEMCQRAIELGARGIYFTNFIQQGNAIRLNEQGMILTEEQIEEFFKQLMRCREKYDVEQLLIERDAGFGPNRLSNHDHFRCPSITEQVVLTPDNNIYPCIFLAKPGYEIGKYEDGKIMIDEKFIEINDGKKCYAKEICNLDNQILPVRSPGKSKMLEVKTS